jgi:hypothetical protein
MVPDKASATRESRRCAQNTDRGWESKMLEKIDNYFYEISSYLIPGFLVFAFVRRITIMATGPKVLWNYENVLKWDLKDYALIDWLVALVGAYVFGMLIAGTMFTILGFNIPLLRYCRPCYGIGRALSYESANRVLMGIDRDVVRADLCKHLGLMKWDRNERKLQNAVHLISQAVDMYLQEKSTARLPSGRYYERMCLCQNLALVVVLLAVAVGCTATKELVLGRILVVGSSVIVSGVLMLYVSVQSVWMAEMRLRRFWVLTR